MSIEVFYTIKSVMKDNESMVELLHKARENKLK